MFGRATITLGIGPHSSTLLYCDVTFSGISAVVARRELTNCGLTGASGWKKSRRTRLKYSSPALRRRRSRLEAVRDN